MLYYNRKFIGIYGQTAEKAGLLLTKENFVF